MREREGVNERDKEFQMLIEASESIKYTIPMYILYPGSTKSLIVSRVRYYFPFQN